MDSKTVQPAVIDAQKLQELQDEIEQEMSNILQSSNFKQVLEKHGVLEDRGLKIQFQCSIELTQIKSEDSGIDQAQGFLPVMRPPHIMKLQCCMDENGRCFKC